jgi:hypothetical protein
LKEPTSIKERLIAVADDDIFYVCGNNTYALRMNSDNLSFKKVRYYEAIK